MNKNSVLVVSAFPGAGKTYAAEVLKNFGIPVFDIDSSRYNKNKFPGNYVNRIKTRIKEIKNADVGFIFVSSHKEVREALHKSEIQTLILYPEIMAKDEYINRYKERGSPDSFIDLVSANYEDWVKELQEEKLESHKYVELKPEDTVLSAIFHFL